ncbi:MAG: hypothetical protein R2795_26200 [Saprospiraceae bacterium]
MSVGTMPQPFTNLQWELLNLYARHVSEADLLEIRQMLADYFFEKAIDQADKIWEEKSLQEDVLLKQHIRVSATKND